MKLHEDRSLFIDAIKFTAQQMELKPEYIEKDYWVTLALYLIFSNDIGRDVVFKGGTSLSKCYQLIERFSEDIDLVVIRRQDESNTYLNSQIRTIGNLVSQILPEVEIAGITRKKGRNRKTSHAYQKEFNSGYGQVRDHIVLETTWLGFSEPHSVMEVSSYVGMMMFRNGQQSLAREMGLSPFNVTVQQPSRTICEKILSLVRFSYSTQPMVDLSMKIRHMYDLHQIFTRLEYASFLDSDEFDDLMLTVARNDLTSYRDSFSWLQFHPIEALIFRDLDDAWKILSISYNGDFKDLVFGNLPLDSKVLETMKMVRNRLGRIKWDILAKP